MGVPLGVFRSEGRIIDFKEGDGYGFMKRSKGAEIPNEAHIYFRLDRRRLPVRNANGDIVPSSNNPFEAGVDMNSPVTVEWVHHDRGIRARYWWYTHEETDAQDAAMNIKPIVEIAVRYQTGDIHMLWEGSVTSEVARRLALLGVPSLTEVLWEEYAVEVRPPNRPFNWHHFFFSWIKPRGTA